MPAVRHDALNEACDLGTYRCNSLRFTFHFFNGPSLPKFTHHVVTSPQFSAIRISGISFDPVSQKFEFAILRRIHSALRKKLPLSDIAFLSMANHVLESPKHE